MNGQGVSTVDLRGKVPVLKLSEIGALQEHRQALGEQVRTWGFMAIELRGISTVINDLHASFRDVCLGSSQALNEIAYTSLPQRGNGGNHGFFPYGSEVPRLAGGVPDPKEFIHVSGAMLRNIPPGSGVLIDTFPAFGENARSVFAAGLDLAQEFFADLLSQIPGNPNARLGELPTILRTIRYRDTHGKPVLAHEHSGIQMLGVQFPPSSSGLQYRLPSGDWIEPILSDTDIVLCNIGRMLEKASGGVLHPSVHRVHVPPGETAFERFSTVLFVHPDHEERQWRIKGDGSKEIFDATWGDFVHEQLLGLQIGGDQTD